MRELLTAICRALSRLIGFEKKVTCNACRVGIPLSDFDKGRAVVLAKRRFCKRCVEEVTRNGAKPSWVNPTSGVNHSTTTVFGSI